MADYLQDLVQNIYTNCDMSGFDDYNRAVNDITKVSKQSAKDRIKLVEQEEKAKIRLADYEDRYARKKKQRDLDEISRMNKRNGLIRAGMRLLGAYLSIRTLQNIIQTGSQLQLLQRSIEGLTGSGQDWQFINEQAFKFGVSLDTVAKGYKNFFSSANMAGFNSNQIQSMFSDILLGARSIGASTQQIEGALLALEQMMSKGRVSMEELRRQLGNALPGAFEIGAKAMGVTTMQFNEMVKAGISAQEFVPKFIKTFKDQYAKGWVDVEQTVAVAQGRLQVAWQQFTMEFLHGESGKALAEGINALADMLRTPEFTQFVKMLSQVFTWVSKIFTWIIRNHKMVLAFLGTAGLYGLLQKNSLLFRLFTKDIGVAIRFLRRFGLTGITAFKGLGAGAKALQGAIFRTLLPLFAAEDIVFGLGQYFLGWNVRSLLGDALMSMKDLNDVRKDQLGLENLKPSTYTMMLKKNPLIQKRLKKAMSDPNGGAEVQRIINENLNYSYTPNDLKMGKSGIMADIPLREFDDSGIDGEKINLEKTETNSVSIGNVSFNIYGAGDPMVAADIFEERLSNLIIGQMGGLA